MNDFDKVWLNHKDGSRIGVEFERREDLYEALADIGRIDLEPYEITTASQSFFSYRPVLSCLQKMTDLPLKEELVDNISSCSFYLDTEKKKENEYMSHKSMSMCITIIH